MKREIKDTRNNRDSAHLLLSLLRDDRNLLLQAYQKNTPKLAFRQEKYLVSNPGVTLCCLFLH